MAKKNIIFTAIRTIEELTSAIERAWGRLRARDIPITDTGGFFAAQDVNAALQEIRIRLFVQTTKPTNGKNGDIWLNTDERQVYIFIVDDFFPFAGG